MALFIRVSIVLCAFAGHFHCQEDSEYGLARIGENCKRDRDCVEHAFCRVQMTCLCDPYYSPSPDKSMCIATVGLSCNNNTVCQTMANAECKQGLCACKDDYFLDNNNSSNCISRPMRIGDRCQITAVCQDTFERALCISEKCQCLTGYHFANKTKSCIVDRGLYTACSHDYECYENDKYPDILECKNHECVCKEGEPRCSKGSLITVAGTLMTILLLLQQIA